LRVDPLTGNIAKPGTPDSARGGITSYQACERQRAMLADIDHLLFFRTLLQRANRANVSFYPIDPRGLPVFDTPIGPEPPLPLAGRNPSVQVPRELDAVVLRGLERDRERRNESQRQLYPVKCGFDIHRSGQPPRARSPQCARRPCLIIAPGACQLRGSLSQERPVQSGLWQTLRRPRSCARSV